MKPQPEPIKKPLKKFVPGNLFEAMLKVDPKDAKKYLDARPYPGDKKPAPEKAPDKKPKKDQDQIDFDNICAEGKK